MMLNDGWNVDVNLVAADRSHKQENDCRRDQRDEHVNFDAQPVRQRDLLLAGTFDLFEVQKALHRVDYDNVLHKHRPNVQALESHVQLCGGLKQVDDDKGAAESVGPD